MFDPEPELITIVEGPTPEFRPSPHLSFQSIYEGPEDSEIAMCELRTLKGDSILKRCRDAWKEGRPVKLDYPDHLRLRQQVDVVAMRLHELEEGPLLVLWISQPVNQLTEEEQDEGEDDVGF
ncbi:MAG: hypothetical protein L0332_16910 [Chloroflexi bacterium]|nr:hypothetical protein [Chloroflexota bacterium]MCI0581023.1 hypothetical protein [Chloroflexota bacterium]MCI0646362.1 hypothetical protein [Chloroflexota bacterium]MCI0728380.1 hypothetical protein [Chloroflexota bacterium]